MCTWSYMAMGSCRKEALSCDEGAVGTSTAAGSTSSASEGLARPPLQNHHHTERAITALANTIDIISIVYHLLLLNTCRRYQEFTIEANVCMHRAQQSRDKPSLLHPLIKRAWLPGRWLRFCSPAVVYRQTDLLYRS